MKRKTAAWVAAAAVLGLGVAGAMAHPSGWGPGNGAGPGFHMGQGYGMGPGHGGMWGYEARGGGAGDAVAATEARLANLKSALRISGEQEAAWKTFAELSAQQAAAMRAWHETMRGSTQASAPERLELHNQIMKQRLEQRDKVTGAFKDLYAALTPEQKTIADQRFAAGPGYGRGAYGGPGGRLR